MAGPKRQADNVLEKPAKKPRKKASSKADSGPVVSKPKSSQESSEKTTSTRSAQVTLAKSRNPDGVRILNAQFSNRDFVAQYANLGSTGLLNEIIRAADHDSGEPNTRLIPATLPPILRAFRTSFADHFGVRSEQYIKQWTLSTKADLFSYARKANGIEEEDVIRGLPLDKNRWPATTPRTRAMVSWMVTMLRLLREVPQMTEDCDQWYPGDTKNYLLRKTFLDGRSPERLHAAFSVLHLINQTYGGQRGELRTQPKLKANGGKKRNVGPATDLSYMSDEEILGAFSAEGSAFATLSEYTRRLPQDLPDHQWGAKSSTV